MKIKTLEEFQKIIEILKVEEKLFFEQGQFRNYYEWLEFAYCDYGNGMEYSWTLKQKYPHDVSYSFPMKDSSHIKTFKTISGAKRNLLKYVSWHFENSLVGE